MCLLLVITFHYSILKCKLFFWLNLVNYSCYIIWLHFWISSKVKFQLAGVVLWQQSATCCNTGHGSVTRVKSGRSAFGQSHSKRSTGSPNWQSKHSVKRLWRGHRSESLWPFIACCPRANAHPRVMSVRSRKLTHYVLSGLQSEINSPEQTTWSLPACGCLPGHREALNWTICTWGEGVFAD